MHYVTYTKSGRTYHKGAGTLKEMRALAYQILSDIPNLIGGVYICDDKKGHVGTADITGRGEYGYWKEGDFHYLHPDGTISDEGSKQDMWRIKLDKNVYYLDNRFDSRKAVEKAKFYAWVENSTHFRIVNQHTVKVLGTWKLTKDGRWIKEKK